MLPAASTRASRLRFLERLAAAAGVAAIPLVGLAETGERDLVCLSATEGACPGLAEALASLQDPSGTMGVPSNCAVVALVGEAAFDPDWSSCCYEAQLDCEEGDTGSGPRLAVHSAGCTGRPYREAGQALTAPIRSRASRWQGKQPTLDGLHPVQRATLSEFWTGIALAEHASMAEFHRVCLELLRFGAPPLLLARAQAAAIDEARHARRCFTLASAYEGRPLQAGELPLRDEVPLAKTLAELAARTARDGCVSETCGAWLFAGLHDRARDPAVREVLAGIVSDETRHAELAWATLRWALSVGGEPVRIAAARALLEPPHSHPDCTTLDDPRLAAHGWAPEWLQARLLREAWSRVVMPMGRQMGLNGSAEPLPS